MAQVLGLVFLFFDYLNGIYFSGWTIVSLTSMIFFGVLRLISGRKGMRLSFFPILGSLIAMLPLGVFFVLFGQWTVALWATEINLPNLGGGL